MGEKENNFTCQYCDKEFTNKGGFTIHLNYCKNNPNKKEKVYICEFCGKPFNNQGGLTVHKNNCKLNPHRDIDGMNGYHNHYKVKCQYCGKEFDVAVIKKHEIACSNLEFNKINTTDYNKDLTCRYCGKQYKDAGNLTIHETKVCKLNPDITAEMRQVRKQAYKDNYQNRSDEAKKKMAWSKGLTKETSEALKLVGEKSSKNLREHPELYNGFLGYHQGSAKWCKYGWYKDFYCDSGWELAVVVYCLENNIQIERNHQGFKYIYNNKEYTYYPDFIVNNIYTEIKGYWNDCEEQKKLQFPYELIILDSDGIKPYLQYTRNKYGENFTEILYDKGRPNYLNNSGKINYKYFAS